MSKIPEPTDAAAAKARRAQIWLYVIMGIFVLAPFVLYLFRRR